MGLINRIIFGSIFAFFLFIFFGFLDIGGVGLFEDSFLTLAGFILLLFMGAIETSVVFYE